MNAVCWVWHNKRCSTLNLMGLFVLSPICPPPPALPWNALPRDWPGRWPLRCLMSHERWLPLRCAPELLAWHVGVRGWEAVCRACVGFCWCFFGLPAKPSLQPAVRSFHLHLEIIIKGLVTTPVQLVMLDWHPHSTECDYCVLSIQLLHNRAVYAGFLIFSLVNDWNILSSKDCTIFKMWTECVAKTMGTM